MANGLERSLVAAVLLAVGCASPAPVALQSKATRQTNAAAMVVPSTMAEAQRASVVIGKLRLRGTELLVLSGGGSAKELHFAVHGAPGDVSLHTLTERELLARFPELHHAFQSSLAQGRLLLDARVDSRYLDDRAPYSHGRPHR